MGLQPLEGWQSSSCQERQRLLRSRRTVAVLVFGPRRAGRPEIRPGGEELAPSPTGGLWCKRNWPTMWCSRQGAGGRIHVVFLRVHAAGKINTTLSVTQGQCKTRAALVDVGKREAGTLAALQTAHAGGYEQPFIPRRAGN